MLVEFIMHHVHWSTIWYPHPGPVPGRFHKRWHVGVRTGPQYDLICVYHCDTNEEANKALSPGARTIFGAMILALIKKYRLTRLKNMKMTDASFPPRDTSADKRALAIWKSMSRSERREMRRSHAERRAMTRPAEDGAVLKTV